MGCTTHCCASAMQWPVSGAFRAAAYCLQCALTSPISGQCRRGWTCLDGRVRPQSATHGDWGVSSRLRGRRPADSCGTTKTGLNDQAVEWGDDKDIETT